MRENIALRDSNFDAEPFFFASTTLEATLVFPLTSLCSSIEVVLNFHPNEFRNANSFAISTLTWGVNEPTCTVLTGSEIAAGPVLLITLDSFFEDNEFSTGNRDLILLEKLVSESEASLE